MIGMPWSRGSRHCYDPTVSAARTGASDDGHAADRRDHLLPALRPGSRRGRGGLRARCPADPWTGSLWHSGMLRGASIMPGRSHMVPRQGGAAVCLLGRSATAKAARNSAQKHVWRARIVLLTADDLGTNEII